MTTVSSNTVSCFEGTASSLLFGPRVAQDSMWLVLKVTSDRWPLILTVHAGRAGLPCGLLTVARLRSS